MNKKTLITVVVSLLMLIMLGVMCKQNSTINKMRELLEKTDTTTVVSTDTLYLEKVYTDTIPTYITQTIYQTDTLYKKADNDSIEAQPIVVTLKKKKQPIQL